MLSRISEDTTSDSSYHLSTDSDFSGESSHGISSGGSSPACSIYSLPVTSSIDKAQTTDYNALSKAIEQYSSLLNDGLRSFSDWKTLQKVHHPCLQRDANKWTRWSNPLRRYILRPVTGSEVHETERKLCKQFETDNVTLFRGTTAHKSTSPSCTSPSLQCSALMTISGVPPNTGQSNQIEVKQQTTDHETARNEDSGSMLFYITPARTTYLRRWSDKKRQETHSQNTLTHLTEESKDNNGTSLTVVDESQAAWKFYKSTTSEKIRRELDARRKEDTHVDTENFLTRARDRTEIYSENLKRK